MARNMLEIENAIIIFKNFSGREKTIIKGGRQVIVNEAGKMNFNVVLDPTKSNIYWNGDVVTNPDFGQELAELGFNIIIKAPRNEEDTTEYRLPVSLGYNGGISPELYLVTDHKKVLMDADSVACLDNADIIKADLVINNGRPYEAKDGKMMVKAWCNKGYFTIAQDRFSANYDFE